MQQQCTRMNRTRRDPSEGTGWTEGMQSTRTHYLMFRRQSFHRLLPCLPPPPPRRGTPRGGAGGLPRGGRCGRLTESPIKTSAQPALLWINTSRKLSPRPDNSRGRVSWTLRAPGHPPSLSFLPSLPFVPSLSSLPFPPSTPLPPLTVSHLRIDSDRAPPRAP